MMEGLKLTVDYFRQQLELNRMIGHSYMRAEPQAQSLSFHEKDINTVDQ